MKATGWFKIEYEKAVKGFEYKLAELEMSVTEDIIGLMEKRKVSRKGLADALRVSKAAVSKLLNNGSNLTLKRLLAIAEALDSSLQVRFLPQNAAVKGIEGGCAVVGAQAVSEVVAYEPRSLAQPQLTVSLASVSLPDDYANTGGYNAVDAA